MSPFLFLALRVLYMEDEYTLGEDELDTNLLVIPDVVNDRFDELCVHNVVDLPIPHWVPNFPTLDDFKWDTILKWCHHTQRKHAFRLVPGPIYSTQIKEH